MSNLTRLKQVFFKSDSMTFCVTYSALAPEVLVYQLMKKIEGIDTIVRVYIGSPTFCLDSLVIRPCLESPSQDVGSVHVQLLQCLYKLPDSLSHNLQGIINQ